MKKLAKLINALGFLGWYTFTVMVAIQFVNYSFFSLFICVPILTLIALSFGLWFSLFDALINDKFDNNIVLPD